MDDFSGAFQRTCIVRIERKRIMDEQELNALCDEMIELKDAIAYHKFELKKLEEKEKIFQIKLDCYLKDNDINERILPHCYFGYVTSSRTAFDQSAFREAEPEMFGKYMKTTETTKLQFKLGAKL